MTNLDDFPCTGEPAVPSIATVIGMTPGQREVLELGRLSTAFVHRQQIEAVDFYSDKVDVFNNLPQGFIGSPIYSVRLVFAQWESDRYRALKDKKRLLELRYLHLKLMKDQNQSDINIEREITHLQKHITTIDYKLSKIEESLE